jgi:mono/diheme cytochrome c family protein
MRKTAPILLVLGAAAFVTACAASSSGTSSRSGEGFTLPEGDPEAGKQVFVQSQCSFCHAVEDVEGLPEPVAQPPVPFTLGQETDRMTDGELVRSIIDPSHFVSEAYPKASTQVGGESRMPAYRNTLTIQQLIDLVAFLRRAY